MMSIAVFLMLRFFFSRDNRAAFRATDNAGKSESVLVRL